MNSQSDTPVSRRALLASAATVAAGATTLAHCGHAAAWPSYPSSRWPRRLSTVRIDVTPNPVPVDAPFTVRLTGLAPGTLTTIRGELRDGLQRWTSEAEFEADQHGAVDLTTHAPREGTYAVPDPMGPVWSALPASGPHNRQFYAEGAVTLPLTITADVAGDEVARVDVERLLMRSAIVQTPLREEGMYGEFFLPASADPVPAILVLGGSEGGLSLYLQREAALLSTHGFAALALAYFRAGPSGMLPTELVNIPLEYFAKAMAWLAQQPGVRGDRIAVIGHSRGGELALILGATYPQLQAVVGYVGSGLVYPSPTSAEPAWTHNGQPLPHFWNPENWSESAIPVEQINGPVLLISAENDLVWQSAILSQFAEDRLLRLNHPFAVEHLRYQGAGHLIPPPYQPATQSLDVMGGTAQANAAAMADSWPRVLRLLNERLHT